MRIDGSIHPEYLNLAKNTGKGEAGKAKPNAGRAEGSKKAEGSEVISAHQSLIQQALAAEDVNVDKIEEARRALESGELDTPEAARRAAGSILDLGL